VKITDVSVTMFNWKSEAWRTGTGAFGGHRLLGVVTVHTDEGVEGHAFLGSSRQGADAYAGPLIEFVKPALVGANPLDSGAIWQRLWKMNRSVSTNAIGAVDVALWDIAGKVAGLPIHRLLGTCRDRVPAYASSGLLPTPEAYGEEAQHFQSLGWTAYKIHPRGVPRDDIKICQAVRRAVGDDMVLMLDSMWTYGYEDAVRVGRAIEAGRADHSPHRHGRDRADGLPVPLRGLADRASAARSARSCAGHVGGSAEFIDEYELFQPRLQQLLQPMLALLLHIRPVLF